MRERLAGDTAAEAAKPEPDGARLTGDRKAEEQSPITVRRLIDRQAVQRSEAVFLVDADAGCTTGFGDLQSSAWSLALELQGRGVRRGECVGCALDNGLAAAQLLLGAMYGGWVALPLNVRAGPESLGWMLRDSRCRLVFVSGNYCPLLHEAVALSGQPVDLAPIEEVERYLGRHAVPLTEREPEPEDPAFLIYTSGSVGRPKGVVHVHRSILAGAANSARAHRLTADDRALLILPLYHRNAETVTLTPSLLTGGSLAIAAAFNPARFWDLLHAHRCTWAALGPSHVSQLVESEGPGEGVMEEVRTRIRFLRCSSGPLTPAVQRRFSDRFGIPLLQALGASEVGNVFTNPLPPGVNKVGSIGLPYGCEVRIVDKAGNEVEKGSVGETLVRGPSLMSGYLRDAKATSEAINAEGWWRSGDLAWQDEDGYYFVAGRSKELIIKGGVNIAPLEIDSILKDHADVLEAAALGVPDAVLGEDIAAFVVLRPGSTTGEQELIAHCESRIGLFKAPARIRFVEELPKSPSGKLQRLKLRDLVVREFNEESLFAGTNFEATRISGYETGEGHSADAVTDEIAGLWAGLLGEVSVEGDTDFFELGGHSLAAMQSVSELRRRYDVALSLSDLFLHPTAAGLAAVVRRRRAAETAAGRRARSIPRSPESQRYVLTRPQQAIWVLGEQNPEEPLYNESEAVLLRGELDSARLQNALQEVLERHEVLRSTIEFEEAGPVATVRSGMTFEFRQFDWRVSAGDLGELFVAEARRPFELEKRPGFRAALIQLKEREHVLLLMMHHVATDRFSFGVVWREIAAGYAAMGQGEKPVLPKLPVQYGDYAVWRNSQDRGPAVKAALEFWKRSLHGAPTAIRWPGNAPRGALGSVAGARRRTAIEPEVADRLRRASRRHAASLFSLFAAAFSTLLHRVCAQDEVVLGIPVAEREPPELQHVVGYLVDMHALRVDHSGNPCFPEVLRRVRAGLADLTAHRSVSFAEVFQALSCATEPGRPPIFQVSLNWRDRDAQLEFIGLEGLHVEPLFVDTGTAKFELGLVITDTGAGGEIRLEWEYRRNWFDAAAVDSLAQAFRRVLEEAEKL